MTAEVAIYVAERHGVLTVPNAALRFTPPAGTQFEGGAAPTLPRGQRLIYMLGDGTALKPVIVKTGITNGIDSEVSAGLREGDRVVTASTAPAKAAGGLGPPGGGPPP
jgi:HlyD family secretion protein